MAMSSEQQIRAMALDSAVRLAAAPNIELGNRPAGAIMKTADEFANYIAGYDIQKQAEGNNNAGRGQQ
jgi:hypothetical protein